MKNRILIPAAFFFFAITSCAVHGVVTERPAEVMYTRPVAPGPGYIWVEGDWFWSGGRYAWREGHWDRPRGGRRWVGGNWEHTDRGYRWRRGHWGR